MLFTAGISIPVFLADGFIREGVTILVFFMFGPLFSCYLVKKVWINSLTQPTDSFINKDPE